MNLHTPTSSLRYTLQGGDALQLQVSHVHCTQLHACLLRRTPLLTDADNHKLHLMYMYMPLS